MLASAGRMRTLIDDLLTFSRVTSKSRPFVPVNLADVVRGVVSDLEFRIHQTDARVEVGPLPTVQADPVQMRQLFQNLIANALKFHKPGVPPTVRVRSAPLGPDTGGPPPGAGWRLTVADDGIGFEPQYAEQIFELFQRLHGRSEYEGTGIGLAVCKKIVDRHGGTIRADGRPGHGATFVIDLPLNPAAAPAVPD
jgi:signal transduction histidine kinase